MLGQAVGPRASVSQREQPASASPADSPGGKAWRHLQSRIGAASALQLDDRGSERAFRNRQVLARGDDVGQELLLVLDGIVGLYGGLPSGETQVLGYCRSGDLIAPARPCEAWGFDVRALTDGTLWAVSLAGLGSPASAPGRPDLVWALFEAACAELARRTVGLRTFWALPVKARLAAFLCELGEAIGEASERGLVLRLPMFRDEIAAYLGTRTETVCRILTGWRDRGAILMDSPRVLVIPDGVRLQADAGTSRLARARTNRPAREPAGPD